MKKCDRCGHRFRHFDGCDTMGHWIETDRGTWVGVQARMQGDLWAVVEARTKEGTPMRERVYKSPLVAHTVMGGWIEGRTIRLDKTA